MFGRLCTLVLQPVATVSQFVRARLSPPQTRPDHATAVRDKLEREHYKSRAQDILEQLKSEKWSTLRRQFFLLLRLVLTEGLLQKSVNLVRVGAGSPQQLIDDPEVSKGWLLTTVRTPVQFTRARLILVLMMLPDGSLVGLNFAPYSAPENNWSYPPYADLDRMEEHDFELSAHGINVGATLTLPSIGSNHPVLILFSGSGACDRDSPIGASKPFKDIAWGLATQGVAVLRFEKPTFAHKVRFAMKKNVTLQDEYVYHAKAAVKYCVNHIELDSNNVFLLGHSLGAWVAPEIATSENDIAGFILMAPPGGQFYHNAIRQLHYFADLDQSTRHIVTEHVQLLEKQAALADSDELSLQTPADKLPLGLGPAYWLSCRSIDAPSLSKKSCKPILILQGGKDYQVTVQDDLAVWRSHLEGKQDADIQVYDKLNHLFIESQGEPSPREYDDPGHVDAAVIEDLVSWVKKQQSARSAH